MLSVKFKSLRYLALFLLVLIVAGCDVTPLSDTYVWIDVPVDGLTYPDVQPVIVKGHAASSNVVSKIELYADGDLWQTIDNPPVNEDLASFEGEWLPPGPGEYIIHAVAYSGDDSPGQPDEVHISLGLEAPTPTFTPPLEISDIPTITDTPTPPPAPETSVAFWADPDTIDAGNCSNIRWRAENVKSVVFGGVEQASEGTYKACLCKGETYTLIVTHLDDSVEKLKVNINVVGTCADTTPPPAPKQKAPGNNASLTCKSYQDLSWNPVSDESGIAEYQVNAQRKSEGGSWQTVAGSTFTGISSSSHNIYVECGWYYRWQVRAVDGEGNAGPWSSWWQFVINLN